MREVFLKDIEGSYKLMKFILFDMCKLEIDWKAVVAISVAIVTVAILR